MPDTINVLGHALPKKGLIAGGVVAAGVTGYIIYRKHKEAALAPAATTTAAGYGYGYAYGYGMGIASYGYGSGVTGVAAGGGAAPITIGYGYGSGIGVGTTTTAPITNAQWAAAAEQYLVDTAGYDATTVAAALGKYLTGGTLTADQAQIVQAALAFENNPPIAGGSGFPPGVHIEAPGGQSGGGGTTPAAGSVTVPNVVGMSVNNAIATLTAAGLTYKLSSVRNEISTYKVNSQTPGKGKKVAKGSNVNLGIVKT